MCEFSRSHKIKCFMTRSEQKNIAARKRHMQMKNSVRNTLFFLFRFSKKTGLADQLKFVRAMQSISIHPSRKICKCDRAPENAETPRWWRLLMARGKKTRLQQFSGHSRLHLFLTDQEFPLPAVVPSRNVCELLERMAWGVSDQSDKIPVLKNSCGHSKFGKGHGVLWEQFLGTL